MKAEDLMIGDWITIRPLNVKTKVAAIKELENGVYVATRNVPEYLLFNKENFEPIPLTPEILEKNGFNCKFSIYAIGVTNMNEPLYWSQRKLLIDIGVRARYICKCIFVHELQHALKLCGIEKEIVL